MRNHLKIALVLLLTLGGCALTPTEVRLSGHVARYEREAPPVEVANCLERSMRDIQGNVYTWRDTLPYGRIDVGGRAEEYGTIALFEISPRDSGSLIFVYLNQQVFQTDRPKFAAEFMRPC